MILSIVKNRLFKIGLTTSAAIVAIKFLSMMLVYHFFTFHKYLALVAIAFLLIGYFLSSLIAENPGTLKAATNKKDEYIEQLRIIRHNLTNREFTIFSFLAEGKTNKEISALLHVQVSTVKTHINNLFAKSGCKNRKEAIQLWDQMTKNQIF